MNSRINFRIHTLALLFLMASSVAGCGGVQTGAITTTPPTTGSSNSQLTGNWEFDLEPATGSAATLPLYKLTGYLGAQSSGSAIVGQLLAATTLEGSACLSANTGVAATGTIDSSSNVTLTGTLAGGTLSIFGNYNATLGEIFGTLNVAGGSCSLASTAIQGAKIANLTGTWIGTMQNVLNATAPTSNATATFSQAASPNPDGSFALNGTISLTGACNGVYAFQGGEISGASFSSEASGASAATQYIAGLAPHFGFGTIPSATVTLTGCSSSYSGALTKQ